tara:strand:+ start:602 stop:1006 length:405 start_codon:yes stop_codon:yes gene_type:complete
MVPRQFNLYWKLQMTRKTWLQRPMLGWLALTLTFATPHVLAEGGADGATVAIKGEIAGSSLRMWFEPATLTVPKGTTVTWINQDGSNHNVKFADELGPRMKHHSSWTRTFSAPGTYPYECAIHGASMSGTIVVE